MFWYGHPLRQRLFSTKSAYELQIWHKVETMNGDLRILWRNLWKANLHNRHKDLVWRAIVKAFPTGDRLKGWLRKDEYWLLCGQELEYVELIILRCPFTKAVWFNSRWQFRLDPFLGWDVVKWFGELLNPHNQFPLGSEQKQQTFKFVGVILEVI